ncbi:DUF2169 domain-containing protein [Sorangium sp. So ce726]|uniref:DUF2169 family type VI secretion system accessory protein n=1 Tax=Sorangium sp. So ce726 TaxID=3133319 RepID=UPI003F61D4E4
MAWRFKGQLHVTAIVKATFAFAHDAAMVRTAPQEILRTEIHHHNNPGRSVRFTSDIAPYLPRADVVFTGHAYAPHGRTVQRMEARIGLFRGAQAILDKSLVIQAKEGFQWLPVVYDRAFGGIGSRENPLGVGLNPGTAEPNVLDPVDPRHPASFGPVGCWMPARKRLLGSTSSQALQRDIADIPDDFDWSYFQAAPPDQQIDALRGDEWILLAGLHATVPCLRMRLPWAAGVARIHGLGGSSLAEGAPLSLRADTLRIDGAEQRCTVVWRGSFPVASEAALASAHVVAGVQVGDEPIAWPAPLASRPPPAPAAAGPQAESLEETRGLSGGDMTLGLTGERPRPSGSLLPFRPGPPTLLALSPRGPARTPPEHALTGTLELGSGAERTATPQAVLPFLDGGERHAEAAPPEVRSSPAAPSDPPPAVPPAPALPLATPPVQVVDAVSFFRAPPPDPSPPSPPAPPRWAPSAALDEPARASAPPRAPKRPTVDVQRLLYTSKSKRA